MERGGEVCPLLADDDEVAVRGNGGGGETDPLSS